jgi:hypothetical protein
MSAPIPAPAVKKTAIATLNTNLASSIERLNNSQTAIGISSSGEFVPYTGTNYINNSVSIKDSIVILDGEIKNIGDTYATIVYADQKITDLIGGAPAALDTLKEIADALNNDASAKATLSQQITTESQRAIAAEAQLTSDLAAEESRAEDVEADLAAALSAETTRATGAETVLTNNLASEVTRSTTADNNQTTAISQEVTDRTAAVSGLNTTLTDLISSNYNTLDTAISTEVSRATGVEGVLTADVTAEVNRATAAEGVLRTDLADEETRATADEDLLRDDLADEVTRATAAEVALDGRVDTIEASYIKKDGTVAFTGDLDMADHKVVSVAAPVSNQDAANKLYVDTKVANLGSVFDYVGTIAAPLDLDSLNVISPGAYYRVTAQGNLTYGAGAHTIYVNIGDGVVFNKVNGWDLIDNTDAVVLGTSGRITLTGDANNGYYVDIASTYVGQASINTVGTVTSGAWEASVVDTTYGGTNFASYTKGDLLVGNVSNKLSKLAVGAAGTILRSDGTDAAWIAAETDKVAITDTTNFAGKSNLQEALDFLYNNTQIRKFAQHEIVSSADLTASAAASTSGKFQAGKVVFVNYSSADPKIYLPKSTTGVLNGSVFRIVHNGVYTDGNLTLAYVDGSNVEHIILELAPKDSISCVWNAVDAMYMFAVGI